MKYELKNLRNSKTGEKIVLDVEKGKEGDFYSTLFNIQHWSRRLKIQFRRIMNRSKGNGPA